MSERDEHELASNEVTEALRNPPPYIPFPSFQEFAASPFDPTTMNRFVELLRVAQKVADPERLESAVRQATRWAAVDTGAIEGLYTVERGFTVSVAASAAAWDNLHLEVGEDARRTIQDQLNAYDYVLDAVTERVEVSEHWIRQLHEVICQSQETYSVLTAAGKKLHDLPKGQYKEHFNSPFNLETGLVHSYAPPSDTPPEMARLVDELHSAPFTRAHPVVQAAYAHYAYVCVHPFADGNGRVARALASVYLYRSPGVPLVIFADQKPAYIGALEAADSGDYGPFIDFLAACAVDTVRMVEATLRRPARPDASAQMAAMRAALQGRGGLSHAQVDALASVLFDELRTAFDRAVRALEIDKPTDIAVHVSQGGSVTYSDSRYRGAPDARHLLLVASQPEPGAATVQYQFGVVIARGDIDAPDFLVVREGVDDILADAYVRDLRPTVNPSLTYRLDIATEDQAFKVLDELVQAHMAALKNAGY